MLSLLHLIGKTPFLTLSLEQSGELRGQINLNLLGLQSHYFTILTELRRSLLIMGSFRLGNQAKYIG